MYRYTLYEAQGLARMPYTYGLLRQKRQGDHWTTIAITAPFSNDSSGVMQLAERCTKFQLDSIQLLDALHDFMNPESRTL